MIQLRHVNGLVDDQVVPHPGERVDINNGATYGVKLLSTKCGVIPLNINRTFIVKQFQASPPEYSRISVGVRFQSGFH